MNRDIFQNISPLDARYSQGEESTLYEELSRYLSEDAVIHSCARCEAALIKAHLKTSDKLTSSISALIDDVSKSIDPEAVYKEEQKTHHNIRALVNVMKAQILKNGGSDGAFVAPYVHLGATSVDILDTALSCRVRDATQNVILPSLQSLELGLCDIAEREASTPQVGRTHGQHAVPITFGFAIAEFVSRLGKSIILIDKLSTSLVGKLSGPVGCYNGMSMITIDPIELEKTYTKFLGLTPSEYSNQLVEPEYILRLLLEMNTAFGIIANLADDLRHLARSEIGEVFEYFSAEQVGSSTMPQKRNPWNSEHVKSLWKAAVPRVMTFFMDQISEHQRDLTNSASERFIADYITLFGLAIDRMTKIIKTLQADRDAMKSTLESAGGKVKGGVLAEPAYILLGKSGENNGHEIIRKITLEAEAKNLSFFEALKLHTDVFQKIATQLKLLNIDAEEFFANSAAYCGKATQKATDLSKKYRELMANIGA